MTEYQLYDGASYWGTREFTNDEQARYFAEKHNLNWVKKE